MTIKSNPKWLNRRSVDNLQKSPLDQLSKPVPTALPWPLFWFMIPLFIGIIVAVPAGILLNNIIPSSKPPSNPSNFSFPPDRSNIPIPKKFSFNLDGWQPSSDPYHYYGVHRATAMGSDEFAKKKLFIPSTNANNGVDRIPLVNDTSNSQVNSEYFSYSFDEDKYLQCSENLLKELRRRVNLGANDSDRIIVPKGYSIEKLHNRIKNTYCTFFKTSRNELINEFKAPYVNKVRNDVVSPKGKTMVNYPDKIYYRRDMWHEHDSIRLGEAGYQFDFPVTFPEGYRSRYKVPIVLPLASVEKTKPGKKKPEVKYKPYYIGLYGNNPHDAGGVINTVFRDVRNTMYAEMFYRYFMLSPYRDIEKLYEPAVKKKIKAKHPIPKTLTRPGMGPKNEWEQIVQRDYTGDTSFRYAQKNINQVWPGTQPDLIAKPENWDPSKELNYTWSADFSIGFYAIKAFLQGVEAKTARAVLNYSLEPNETITKDEWIKYFLRATFDNSRNILLNRKFGATSSISNRDLNQMYLHDAYLTGPARGLGRFTYESPSVERPLGSMINGDQEAFEYDMFEEKLRSHICTASLNPSPFRTAYCPTVKKALTATNGTTKNVLVPTKANEATEYFAELAEINNLWEAMYIQLDKIIKENKYNKVPFETYDNDVWGGAKRVIELTVSKDSTAKVKRSNFDIFDAFLELFRNPNVLRKLAMGKQSSQKIKDKMEELILKATQQLLLIKNLRRGNTNSLDISYANLQKYFENTIRAIQNVINFYGKSEANRKLDLTYTITATNSNNLTFKYPVIGRNLTYHLYVRYMKLHEAKEDYSFDENGNEIEFKIQNWEYDNSKQAIKTFKPPIISERTVKVKDANDSELTFFVIHYLKDTRFPWIPLRYGKSKVAVNIGHVPDIYLSNYSPKYDKMIENAEKMINDYMSVLLTKKYTKVDPWPDPYPPGRLTKGDFKIFEDFDVVETKETANRALALYKENPRVTGGEGYFTPFFANAVSRIWLLGDFIAYAQGHYLASPNQMKPLFANNDIVTHCITTYESTGGSKELGFDNVLPPTKSTQAVGYDPNHKLTKLFDVFRTSLWLDKLIKSIESNVYIASTAYIGYRTLNNSVPSLYSKYIHIYFSKCLSNEQYNTPLDPTSPTYNAKDDEWKPMLKKIRLRIFWDYLDVE